MQNLNIRLILKILGLIYMIIAAAMIPSLIVGCIYDESIMIKDFSYAMIVLVFFGGVLQLAKPTSTKIRMRDAFLIVTLAWVSASIAGAMPFIMSASVPNIFDAIFESVSGFTTTGSSVLTNVEELPKSLLFWRSFTHWIGGMGILVFAIAILPALGIGGFQIIKAEAPGPTLDKVTPKMSDTAKLLYVIYIGMTLVETTLLLIGGMNLFDALVHTFGTVGTGGFSSYGTGVAHFSSFYIDLVITIFMILAGVNFNLYYDLIKGRWKTVFLDSELRFYLAIIGGATVIIGIILFVFGTYDSIIDIFRYAFFQVASITTTTGYATADFDLWPTPAKIILFLLIFMGGCSSSTAGALKSIRVLIICKLVRREFFLRLHPQAVLPIKLRDKHIPSQIVSNVVGFVYLYLAIFAVGCLLISLEGFDFVTTITSVATTISCVGPGMGAVGPMLNFSEFSNFSKMVFSFLMLVGRLELFTVIILFTPSFWRSTK